MFGAIIGDILGSRWEYNLTNDYMENNDKRRAELALKYINNV